MIDANQPDAEIVTDVNDRTSMQGEAALPIDREAALPVEREAALPIDREAALPIDREAALPIDREAALHMVVPIAEAGYTAVIKDNIWGGCSDLFAEDEDCECASVTGGLNQTSKNIADTPLAVPILENECALDVNGPTCLNDDAIVVVKKYLKKHTTERIGDPLAIMTAAKNETRCETQECAIRKIAAEMPDSAQIIQETLENNFLVSGPADSQKWLNNDNIDKVLSQFCVRHPKVYHMNFHMINFDAHITSNNEHTRLARLDMYKDVITAGYDMFCVVINTDTYGRSGIHWFCIVCDFRTSGSATDPFTIEYFNSSGQLALPEIQAWMIKTEKNIEYSSDHKYCAKCVRAAPIQHQRDTDSECGVYSLFYIYKRIHKTPIEFFHTRIPDADMIKFRKKLFKNRSSGSP